MASERSKVKLFAPGIEMDWEFYHRESGRFEAAEAGSEENRARVALLRVADPSATLRASCVRPTQDHSSYTDQPYSDL